VLRTFGAHALFILEKEMDLKILGHYARVEPVGRVGVAVVNMQRQHVCLEERSKVEKSKNPLQKIPDY
jgi:hypothetical protein